MSIRFTSRLFPRTPHIKTASGLPWGVVVQPYAPLESVVGSKKQAGAESTATGDDETAGRTRAEKKEESDALRAAHEARLEDVPRCTGCYAYINRYVQWPHVSRWVCALCRTSNSVEGVQRYANVDTRHELPELRHELVQLNVDAGDLVEEQSPLPEAYVLLVDLEVDDVQMQTVLQALNGIVEFLAAETLVALVCFSDHVGLFDLRAVTPHLKRVAIRPHGEASVAIDEVFDPLELFVSVGDYRTNIQTALQRLPELRRRSPGGRPRRGYGAALKSVVDFLAENAVEPVRIMSFLCGPPSYGVGAIDDEEGARETNNNNNNNNNVADRDRGDGEGDDEIPPELLLPTSGFYRSLAHRAAEAGICVDQYVFKSSAEKRPVGLSSLKFFVLRTGGRLNVYATPAEAESLPQDIYRDLSRPRAIQGLLRLRTSGDFVVSDVTGHVWADESYEGMYHIESCDESSCITFDLDFDDPYGFGTSRDYGVVQMAFAFTELPPAVGGAAWRPRKIVRVRTVKVQTAKNVNSLFTCGDPEVVLSVLLQRILRVALDSGLSEARIMAEDWMTLFLARYQEVFFKNSPDGATQRLDASFSRLGPLRFLPRYMYGLLQSELLNHRTSATVDVDRWNYLHALFTAVDAHHTRLFCYPSMTSFNAPTIMASQNVPLTRVSVNSSGSKIFVVHSLFRTRVFNLHAGADYAFPPQEGTLLRRFVSEQRRASPVNRQCVAPLVQYLDASKDDALMRVFDALMLEDASDGYGVFLDERQSHVHEVPPTPTEFY